MCIVTCYKTRDTQRKSATGDKFGKVISWRALSKRLRLTYSKPNSAAEVKKLFIRANAYAERRTRRPLMAQISI